MGLRVCAANIFGGNWRENVSPVCMEGVNLGV